MKLYNGYFNNSNPPHPAPKAPDAQGVRTFAQGVCTDLQGVCKVRQGERRLYATSPAKSSPVHKKSRSGKTGLQMSYQSMCFNIACYYSASLPQLQCDRRL